MKKRIILAIVFVLFIGLGIFFAFKLNDIENTSVNNENINANTDVNANNIENNTISKNELNNIVNITNNVNTEEVNSSAITKEEDKKEKAINIAKDDWGEDDTVSFIFDNINRDGKYVVCVRDKKTTNALYWYIIDIDTGTFMIE